MYNMYNIADDFYLYPHFSSYSSIDDLDLFAVYPYLRIHEKNEILAIKVIGLGFCLLSLIALTALLHFKLERNKIIHDDEKKDDMV